MTKVMLVTGGSRGIGAAVARLAARDGWDVTVNYARDRAAAERVVAEVAAFGRRAVAVQADMGVPADVARLYAEHDRAFGRLDALINNAGIVGQKARTEEIDDERVTRLVAINVTGAFLAAREAIRRMSTSLGGEGGSIVNMSSAAVRLGSPGEYVDYATSKGAIDSMTTGMAREQAAHGVRVNAIRPGLIETEIHASGGQPDRVARLTHMIPMLRPGTAEEVAETALWLCSPAASYVTGAIIDVSGGR